MEHTKNLLPEHNTHETSNTTGTTGHTSGLTGNTTSGTGLGGQHLGGVSNTGQGSHIGQSTSKTSDLTNRTGDSGMGMGHSSGPHSTETANHLDPSLPGPAPNTAGPHKKDWLNKLDPRVDATGTKGKVHSGDQHETDSVSHSKGPVALGGPTAVAPTHDTVNYNGGLGDQSYSSTQSGNEHHREKGAAALADKPVGTDIGDKLHGVERNRGPRAGDVGHHAGGEHSTHVGHGHTSGDEHSHGTAGTTALFGSALGGEPERSSHHIGGDRDSHVGHGHTGHDTGAYEKSASNVPKGASDINSGKTTSDHPAGFNEERRGTTSGLHTDPRIHHVPEVGHKHHNV